MFPANLQRGRPPRFASFCSWAVPACVSCRCVTRNSRNDSHYRNEPRGLIGGYKGLPFSSHQRQANASRMASSYIPAVKTLDSASGYGPVALLVTQHESSMHFVSCKSSFSALHYPLHYQETSRASCES